MHNLKNIFTNTSVIETNTWVIEKGITEITSDFVNQYMPAGTTHIVIPEGVTSIEWAAFEFCSSLTQIEIPEGVTRIGSEAFSGCSSLTEINLPEGVTSIGQSAFEGCTSLTEINLPEGVTSIEWAAFTGCTNLTQIEIPEGVTNIEWAAFTGCSSLRQINIPEGVTNIGRGTLESCTSLTEINLPAGVTSIGEGAFRDCTSLTEINIPERVTRIGEGAFQGCTSLTEINLPEGVTSIGYYAFTDCTSVTEINIPEGVTRIGRCAFYGCSSLTEINIPEGVTRIEDHAFSGCSSLRTIILPDHFCTDTEKQRLGISEAVCCISCNAITQFYSDSLQVTGLYNTGQKIALYRLCTDRSFGQHDLSTLQDCLMVDIKSAIRKREELLGASENNTILSNRLIGVNQSTEEVSSKLYTGTQQLPDNIISYLTAKDFCNLRTITSGRSECKVEESPTDSTPEGLSTLRSDQSVKSELTVKQFSLFNKITCYRRMTALAIVGIAAAALMYSQFATIVAIVGIAALLYKLNHSSNHSKARLGVK